MKISRFTDSQIMAILKQNEAGASVPDLCREHGISSASVYKWRAKFGGMDASLMKRGVFQGSWHSFLNIYAALFTASTVGFCGFSSTASI